MIRGKKNFLYPAKMELGLCLLFRVEESGVEKHKDERKLKEELVEKGVLENGDEIQMINEEKKKTYYLNF